MSVEVHAPAVPATARPWRELVSPRASLAQVARAVRDDVRPFVLSGRWAGGDDVVAGGAPLLVHDDGAGALEAFDALPRVVGGAGGVVVGGGWFGFLGAELGRRVEMLPGFAPARGATAREA